MAARRKTEARLVESKSVAHAINRNEGRRFRDYFRPVEIEVNLVLSLEPSPFTAAMMASAMPAAISPYSMAVAPDSSPRNRRMVVIGRLWPKNLKAN